MNKTPLSIVSICLIAQMLLGSGPAVAVNHPFDFHADARMVHQSLGPVEQAYGYMNVITNPSGSGVINVMFSNGSPLNQASFNARVRFLDATGAVIKEEFFRHRINAAANGEAIERKVSKPLAVSDFESIQVEFYLTD